jgi:hypothetical protein
LRQGGPTSQTEWSEIISKEEYFTIKATYSESRFLNVVPKPKTTYSARNANNQMRLYKTKWLKLENSLSVMKFNSGAVWRIRVVGLANESLWGSQTCTAEKSKVINGQKYS